MVHLGNGVRQGMRFYIQAQLIPGMFRHLLGVVEERMKKIGRKNYRRGKYRSGQAAPACFVATRFYSALLVFC